MSHLAEEAVSALRTWAEGSFPGSTMDMSILDVTDTQWGFGIAAGGGLTLVWADVTNAEAGPWSVQLSGGLAIDVPDREGSLRWANNKNRGIAYGKCYCALAESQNLAAVLYENTLPGASFELIFNGPHGPGTFQSLVGWVRGILDLQVRCTAQDGADIINAHGGKRFEPGESGLWTVFSIAGGG